MQDLWQSHRPPFDGVCLHLRESVPVAKLRTVLSALVEALKHEFRDENLAEFDDWHEHDGFVTAAHPATWDSLESHLASDSALCKSCPNDTYVCKAFYPESRAFLLRYLITDDDESNISANEGDCDFTGSGELLSRLVMQFPSEISDLFHSMPAKEFFDDRYSG